MCAAELRSCLSILPVLQLRRACDAATTELASVTADKAQLSQQHDKAQESIDALVAELQDTLGRLEQQQQQAGQLSDRLQQVTADAAVMQKQVRRFARQGSWARYQGVLCCVCCPGAVCAWGSSHTPI